MGQPAKDLSVNFVPVPYPDYPTATVAMNPGERQLWRVLNASSVTYVNLAAIFRRGPKFRPQWLGVVAVDGVPLSAQWQSRPWHRVARQHCRVSGRAGRVHPHRAARRCSRRAGHPSVDTGPGGENDPNRPLLKIVAAGMPAPAARLLPACRGAAARCRCCPGWAVSSPTRVRKLYFSEQVPDPADPNARQTSISPSTGRQPAAFDPTTGEPNIVVQQGDVEDWIIENRSTRAARLPHPPAAFPGGGVAGPGGERALPARHGRTCPFTPLRMQAYPSVRLRMDFRDPNTVGTFVYHCHLLDHEDRGMMGLIRVEPAPSHYASPCL